jgi:hypothetical protein
MVDVDGVEGPRAKSFEGRLTSTPSFASNDIIRRVTQLRLRIVSGVDLS